MSEMNKAVEETTLVHQLFAEGSWTLACACGDSGMNAPEASRHIVEKFAEAAGINVEPPCPFCTIEEVDHHYKGADVKRIIPLNPVVPGHRVFFTARHATHPDPDTLGNVMSYAATYANGMGVDFNLITSSGKSATQTVEHLHVHYVPRTEGDGLHLPWTGQEQ